MNDSYKKPVLKSLYFNQDVDKIPSLKGKTIAITGTTSGTGYVAAKVVAKKGATTILINRKSDRSKKTYELLTKKYPQTDILNVECDLQSFSSVRSAAQIILKELKSGLDVLCNNAGVMALKDQATADGFDIQMQINHLSHFLLTKELMPILKIAAAKNHEARIINHSSIARFGVKKLELSVSTVWTSKIPPVVPSVN